MNKFYLLSFIIYSQRITVFLTFTLSTNKFLYLIMGVEDTNFFPQINIMTAHTVNTNTSSTF